MAGWRRATGVRRKDAPAIPAAAVPIAVLSAFVLTALQARPSQAADRCASLPPPSVVIALDEGSRTTQAFETERELRGFALYSYRNIAGDLVNGRGPYLEALAHPFRAACADNDSLVGWLRGMLAGADSATEFSRRIGVALAAVRSAERQEPTRSALAAGSRGVTSGSIRR